MGELPKRVAGAPAFCCMPNPWKPPPEPCRPPKVGDCPDPKPWAGGEADCAGVPKASPGGRASPLDGCSPPKVAGLPKGWLDPAVTELKPNPVV